MARVRRPTGRSVKVPRHGFRRSIFVGKKTDRGLRIGDAPIVRGKGSFWRVGGLRELNIALISIVL